ncbi:MAG TPA: isochorismate synthase [Solirubrobacteraceae bacterium]|jgi:salicylate biosynthesis isochorismate synthase/menaquinone-specific isochorismate synthase|nr:isochorismate synthase [Solirubrobacteraceae bacterium]
MTEVRSGTPAPAWLDASASAHLERRLEAALRRARSSGTPTLASLTAPVDRGADPTAVVCASRRPGEPWVCLEQPDRDGAALAALGCALTLEAHGQARFKDIAAQWRSVTASAVADPADGPAGSGLAALGGFAFSPTGGSSPPWAGFAPASLVVPELSLARRGDDVRLTLNLRAAPDDTVEDLLGRAYRRLGELRRAPLPMLDPAPAGLYEVVSAMPPSHYEHAVARAVERIRAGELEKIVLAREVQVHAPVEHDPAAVLGVLREAFPTCYVYAVGRGEATFIGASPELLLRREGQRASTVALAGSTRRSADPAVDNHLGEQLLSSDKDRHENAIVARRIVRALDPHSVWVTAAPEPVIVRVLNIQHLACPIRAQLAAPVGAVELVSLMHPTPAVGGEPSARALEAIPSLEGFDRGWYAGPIGWIDASGDGELCVALRCALLRGKVAHCYAGCGIVRDSDPTSELAESEIKLEAMLPVLAG